MKFLYLEFQLRKQREELQGNQEMKKIVEQYGDAFIAMIYGGAVINFFIQILGFTTSF